MPVDLDARGRRLRAVLVRDTLARHTFDMLKLLERADRGGLGGHAAAVE
jgi:hypothetical protein